MSKTKLALAFAVFFLFGAAAGGAGGMALAWHLLLHPPAAEDMANLIGSKLQSKLQLTPEQANRIRPLVLHTATQFDAVRRDTFRRLKQVTEEGDSLLAAELTPEQQQKFQEFKRSRPKLP